MAEGASCRVVRAESNAVVPLEVASNVASNKREHAARTLRPKIRAYLGEFLVELAPTQVEKTSLGMDTEGGLDLCHAGRHRLVPRRNDRAPRALDLISNLQKLST